MPSPLLEEELAGTLLDIGAVSLQPADPFTWASGLRSPVYCDNRMIMGFPEVRARTTAGFLERLQSLNLKPDLIAGTATAGIPHAAWLAQAAGLPMVYVRPKPKAHGQGRQIEGPARPGQTAVVVEDLISTGSSSLAAVECLRAEGLVVPAVLAVFSYGLDEATRAFEAAGVDCHTLSSFDALLKVAVERGLLPADQLETLRTWRRNPHAWSEQYGHSTD